MEGKKPLYYSYGKFVLALSKANVDNEILFYKILEHFVFSKIVHYKKKKKKNNQPNKQTQKQKKKTHHICTY